MFFPIRDEGGGGGDWVNKSLIVLNVFIFLALWILGINDFAALNFGTTPSRVVSGAALYTLLTSMFLHGGFSHIIGNMWFLWIFGDNIERAFGHAKYLVFYLVTGLAGSVLHILSHPSSMIPAVGASGAISGVLGAYLALYPRNRIDAVTTFGVIAHMQVSAKIVIGLWFLLQLFYSGFLLVGASTGVAYLAHVGGFVAGYAAAKVFLK